MALLGTLILAFLIMHMGDFWFKMKFTDQLELVKYESFDNIEVKNLYKAVETSFKEWWIVAAYILGQVALFFHLSHGFASAFQTLGLNHRKYTPFIKALGWGYSIAMPLGFALIPIIYFLTKNS